MATNYAVNHPLPKGQVRELTFAGDYVCLSGQMDYPETPIPINGFPLLFMLPRAGANTRTDYHHFAELGLYNGYAVFRWDRRGTGRSGAGGRGSTTQDAILAYKTALGQLSIDPRRAVILAQCASTVMLGDAFSLFTGIQNPRGVILIGNMLDPESIPAIDTRLYIVMAERDWNDWKTFARDACDAHNEVCGDGASYYVADQADRMLMVEGGEGVFHDGASHALSDWLLSL